MTEDVRIAILSQQLDDVQEHVQALRKAVELLTAELQRLEYRMGQQNRAMERMAQYVGQR